MTSFKSSHAFEGFLSSGLPGRPPAPRRHSSSTNTNNQTSSRSITYADQQQPSSDHDYFRERAGSTSNAAFQDPFTHPHSTTPSYHTTGGLFSSSLVREQSLALGDLERRQSFDFEHASSHQQGSASSENGTGGSTTGPDSWATVSATSSSVHPSESQSSISRYYDATSNQGGQHPLSIRRQSMAPDPNAKHLERPIRSPPSGLSLLLKTNGRASTESNGGSLFGNREMSTSGSVPSLFTPMDSTHGQPNLVRVNTTESDNINNINNIDDDDDDDHDDGDEYDDAAIEHMLASASENNTNDNDDDGARGKRRGVGSWIARLNPFSSSSSEDPTKQYRRGKGKTQQGTENEPLIPHGDNIEDGPVMYDSLGQPSQQYRRRRELSVVDDSLDGYRRFWRETKWTKQVVFQKFVAEPTSYLPAVILGLLLNLLDAVSYGKKKKKQRKRDRHGLASLSYASLDLTLLCCC